MRRSDPPPAAPPQPPLAETDPAHGLRTPLTALMNYISLMELRGNDQAVRDEKAHERLLELVPLARDSAAQMREAIRALVEQLHASGWSPQQPNPSARETRAMSDLRFEHHWHMWDQRLAAGESRESILGSLTSTEMAELLAADSAAERGLERNILATALGNRLARGARSHPIALVKETAQAITHANRTLTTTRKLLTEVSAARDASARQRAAPPIQSGASNGNSFP